MRFLLKIVEDIYISTKYESQIFGILFRSIFKHLTFEKFISIYQNNIIKIRAVHPLRNSVIIKNRKKLFPENAPFSQNRVPRF